MKKYAQIFIIILIGYLIGDSIYTEMTKDKTPGKTKRLACQEKVTTFERVFSNPEVKHAQRLIEHGNIEFTSSIEKSIYEESTLFNYTTLLETNQIFNNSLHKYVKSNDKNDEKYHLSYYIYENDIKDPGKKTQKSKMYAGYVVLTVKNINNKVIYKVQIDFMDKQGSDIKETIECTIESFMTVNK